MLNPTDNWKRTIGRAGNAPAVLVELTVGGVLYRFCRAQDPLYFNGSKLATPNILDEVSPVGAKVDALTRKASLSEIRLVFNDDRRFREVLGSSVTRIYGQQVRLYWGDASLAPSASADFLPLWTGLITDLRSRPGEIELVCHDTFSLLSGDVRNYSAVNKHPLQIALDLLTFALGPSTAQAPAVLAQGASAINFGNLFNLSLNALGITKPNESLVDVASFNPDLYPTGTYPISHWNTVRAIHDGVDRHISKPEKIAPMLDELALLCGGTIAVREDGRIGYTHYDPGTAAVTSISLADHDSVEQVSSLANPINRASCLFDWDGQTVPRTITERQRGLGGSFGVPRGFGSSAGDAAGSSSGFKVSIVRDDVASQHGFANPPQTSRVLSESLETKWVGVSSAAIFSTAVGADPAYSINQMSATTPGPGDAIQLAGGWLSGFCGMPRLQNVGGVTTTITPPIGSSQSFVVPKGQLDGCQNSGLTNSRVGYILIDNEIIAVQQYFNDTVSAALGQPDQFGDSGQYSAAPPNGNVVKTTVRILQRGALGTVAATHGGSAVAGTPGSFVNQVWDVTIPQAVVQRWLDRFADGAPEVILNVKLHLGYLQLGDLVTFTSDFILAYGLNGVTTASQWEICGLDRDVTAASPTITLRLVLAKTPPSYTNNYASTPPGTGLLDGLPNVMTGGGVQNIGDIIRGMNPSWGGSISDQFSNAIASGALASSFGGLLVSLAAGNVSRPGALISHPVIPPQPLAPNADNYVAYDVSCHGYVNKTVAIGGTAPGTPPSHANHGKFTATAAGVVTQAADYRALAAVAANPFKIPAAMVVAPPVPASGNNPLAVVFDIAATNYLLNPSFENNVTDGWTTYASSGGLPAFVRDATTSWLGSASGKITTLAAATDHGIQSSNIAAVNGDKFVASAYFVSDTAARGVRLRIQFLAADGVTALTGSLGAVTLNGSVDTFGGYTRVLLNVQATDPGTAFVRMQVLNDGTANVYNINVDACQLEKNYCSTYLDGSMGPGYSWTGTPNNSASSRIAGFHTITPPTNTTSTSCPFIFTSRGGLRVEQALSIGASGDDYVVSNFTTGAPGTGGVGPVMQAEGYNLDINVTIAPKGSGTFSVSSYGLLGKRNQFLAHTAVDQTLIGADTKLLFATIDLDQDTAYASSRYTPPTPGIYFVWATVKLATFSVAAVTPTIYLSQTGNTRATAGATTAATTNQQFWTLACFMLIVAGDWIEVHGIGTGGTFTVSNSTIVGWFGAKRIG